MKKIKFIHILIVIALIIVLILSYMLINKNAVIESQEKEIELKTMEANGSNSYILTSDHFGETVKVWNKTYAYDDFTWTGYARSATSYQKITDDNYPTASIIVNLEDEEIIDVSRIKGWTIRLWTSNTTSSIEDNGYGFRSNRAANGGYWYEYPVLNAAYDSSVDENATSEFYNQGKIGKTSSIQYPDNEVGSFWNRTTSNKPSTTYVGLNGDITFTYNSTTKNMELRFERARNSKAFLFTLKGYPVMDVTIYYI